MTAGFLDTSLATVCVALGVLLVAVVAVHLLVIRPRLARATYLTVVRVIEQDLAQDERDGAVSPDAPAVNWLHSQLTLQRGHPGRLLDRREVCDAANGAQTARLVRGYVAELLEAHHDYLATRAVLARSLARPRTPQPRHALAPRPPAAPAEVDLTAAARVDGGYLEVYPEARREATPYTLGRWHVGR